MYDVEYFFIEPLVGFLENWRHPPLVIDFVAQLSEKLEPTVITSYMVCVVRELVHDGSKWGEPKEQDGVWSAEQGDDNVMESKAGIGIKASLFSAIK